jgi:hypothetical protein
MTPQETRRPALVELRRYSLHRGRRDELIELFDRELVETQEAVGLQVVAEFRDVDEPDQFVWLRGFASADPEARGRALATFYGGPVWGAHGPAANATMIAWDDVHLLRAAWPGTGLTYDIPPPERRTHRAMLATTCLLDAPAEEIAGLGEIVNPLRQATTGALLAVLATARIPNAFPGLPVRERDHALVWLQSFADLESLDRYVEGLERAPGWADGAPRDLAVHLREPPRAARLVPTDRSALPT